MDVLEVDKVDMSQKVRAAGERVRAFILEAVGDGRKDVVARAAEKFDISRQAVHAHIKKLSDAEALEIEREGRKLIYKLKSEQVFTKTYRPDAGLDEGDVWDNDVRPILDSLPGNVLNIWHHGFTEMFNNALDHSEASEISVTVKKSPISTQIVVHDNGVGIFHKIQRELDLADPRLAIFELSKGKLTTDPSRHSGEGIFFTSRMMDYFVIRALDLRFVHDHKIPLDFMGDYSAIHIDGTQVTMELRNHTSQTTKKIFDAFTTDLDEYAFDKTIVPLKLARLGGDQLVSRSQAKRALARIDKFKYVVFDFKEVDEIGQAFADEIFRVYQKNHPDITLADMNANAAVRAMIKRARQGGAAV